MNQKLKKLNEKEEIVYLLRSYNNKHIIATLVLAKYYYYGDSKVGIHKNENKAFELFNENVDKIDEAKYYLGLCYYGQGTKVNYKKAKSLFSEAYKNNSRAGVYLGFCYQYGKGVKSDYEKALTYYEKASKDSAFGKVALARAYCYGMGDYLKPDYNKGINLNIEAIKESEITSAYFDLGYCYKNLKDYKNAEKNYKKVIKIDNDNVAALFNLGQLYATDDFEGRDYKEAFKYYEMAYKKGDTEAALTLASMKLFANYNMVDMEGALPYLEVAYKAKEKNSDLYFTYYYQQHKKDEKKAFENYQKAYELFQENPYVWYRLGRCYYFGNGVERDVERAYDFLSQAANKDFKDAKEFIEEYFHK